jgi:UDPglucose--hexose-1-phosphate uridylyltransferase
MEFPKSNTEAELLSPPLFHKVRHSIEYREDSLTGARCRINVRRTEKLRKAPARVDLSQVIGRPDDCPFCPQNIEQATPLFVEGFCPGGRIKRGECCFFPNLFPLAEYHAAGTLTSSHFLDLEEFQPQMLIDNMLAAREFLVRVSQTSREAWYPIYLWNHLPPSAASVVHPHVQILVDRQPTPYQQRLLESSRDYFRKMGSSYWWDIGAEEKRIGQRWIGEKDSVAVIASYAPQGNREAQIIFKETSNLVGLTELQITGFADCLIRLLRGYKQMGVNSFNLTTFSAPLGEELDYYSLHAKLISRPVWQPFYRNDTGILERFHYEADIELEPEAFAKAMRAFWGDEGGAAAEKGQ